MEIVRHLQTPADAPALFRHVDDLDAYTAWMPLIHAVERHAPDDHDGIALPAWSVELRARVGPLARSKRLRMERTERVADRLAVFERAERDGRDHAPWILRAELAPHPDGTDLTMRLTYGGSLWAGAALHRILDDQVRRGSAALLAIVSAT
ncbi:SRPBCC family protein [Ilumatobacter sp.]|uniref:SRPBCC family protein n=1 Tax=Ilumatobacter sp. TaxID=1967498 RepID=UPI003B5230FA